MIETVIYNGYEFQIDREHPSWRFKGGSKPKPIAPTPVAPTPVELDEEIKQKDRDKRRQRASQSGRQGTILNQGQSLASGNATLLGRSTS